MGWLNKDLPNFTAKEHYSKIKKRTMGNGLTLFYIYQFT
jgi:hypothetical protein